MAIKNVKRVSGNYEIQVGTNQKLVVDFSSTGSTLFLAEQANAADDVSGLGQIWVKTGSPNTLWFTDSGGTDYQLGAGGAGGDPNYAGEDQTAVPTASGVDSLAMGPGAVASGTNTIARVFMART